EAPCARRAGHGRSHGPRCREGGRTLHGRWWCAAGTPRAASIEPTAPDCKKKYQPDRKPGGRSVVRDLASADHLAIGDERANGGANVPAVAAQLALELTATRVAERARAELEVRPLHLATAVEEPIDLGERQQPHPLRRQIVGDGEQPGEEARVMTGDLI